MNTCYLDTSALLRWILQSPGYYKEFGKWDFTVTSELTKLEVYRSLDRLWKRKSITLEEKERYEEYFQSLVPRFHWIRLDSYVLEKAAGNFPHSVGALDSIHLATAILYLDEYEAGSFFFLTHDEELGRLVQSLGIPCRGV